MFEWYVDVFTTETWLGPSAGLGRRTGNGILSVSIALVLARAFHSMTSTAGKALISGLAFAPLITPAILLAIGEYDVQLRLGLTGTIWD